MSITIKVVVNDSLRRLSLSESATLAELRQLLAEFVFEEFQLKYRDEDGDDITIATDLELKEAIRQAKGSVLRMTVVTAPSASSFVGFQLVGDSAFDLNSVSQAKPHLSDNLPSTAAEPKTTERKTGDNTVLIEDASLSDTSCYVCSEAEEEDDDDDDGDELDDDTDTEENEEEGLTAPLLGNAATSANAEERATRNGLSLVEHGVSCSFCFEPICGIRYKCAVCKSFDLCASCESFGYHEHHPFIKAKQPLSAQFETVHNITAGLFAASEGLDTAQTKVTNGVQLAQEHLNKTMQQPQVAARVHQIQEVVSKASEQVNQFLAKPEVQQAKTQALVSLNLFADEAKSFALRCRDAAQGIQAGVADIIQQRQQAADAAQAVVPQQVSQPAPAPLPADPFAAQIKTLQEMGFTGDVARLRRLLLQHDGSIPDCVNDLCA